MWQPGINAYDPVALFEEMFQLKTESWQRQFLRNKQRGYSLLVCARGGGKSMLIACRALHEILYAGREVLLIAPSQRHVNDVLRHVRQGLRHVLHPPLKKDTESVLEFINGKRILALSPGMAAEGSDWSRIRGTHVPSVFIDESQKISDEMWAGILPVLSAEKDPLLCLAGTPAGRRGLLWGFFNRDNVVKTILTGEQIPHLNCELMKDLLDNLDYRQEIMVEFLASDDIAWTLGTEEQIDGMVTGEVSPL